MAHVASFLASGKNQQELLLRVQTSTGSKKKAAFISNVNEGGNRNFILSPGERRKPQTLRFYNIKPRKMERVTKIQEFI